MFLKNSNFEFCSKTIRLKKSHGKEFRIQFKQTVSNLLQPILNYNAVINTFFLHLQNLETFFERVRFSFQFQAANTKISFSIIKTSSS